MKLAISIIGLAGLALVSCEDFSKPMPRSSFDPLAPPGSMQDTNVSYAPEFSPGQFVSAAVNNTAFYNEKPTDNEEADKLIDQGTQMKIVEVDPDHLKVELDSGAVGWVPKVMVMSGATANDMVPVDGVYQVYPPLPGDGPVQPLPLIDAEGLPPEGAIPALIDPDAPIEGVPPTLDTVPDIQPVEPENADTTKTPEATDEDPAVVDEPKETPDADDEESPEE